METKSNRCAWAGTEEPYISYHDLEWGVPLHDDQKLFEMINLEGAQAGLSWITILKKRPNYQKAFDNFDPHKVVKYSEKKIEKLLADPGIVRNKLKVNAVVSNAAAYFKVLSEYPSFDEYLWQFVDRKPIINRWKSMKEVPAFTKESDVMSKDLKKRGFKFVGTTICYAFMQAVGMVNDHTLDCFRWKECR
jgi:DNA-3-methyladenine glycosylase I